MRFRLILSLSVAFASANAQGTASLQSVASLCDRGQAAVHQATVFREARTAPDTGASISRLASCGPRISSAVAAEISSRRFSSDSSGYRPLYALVENAMTPALFETLMGVAHDRQATDIARANAVLGLLRYLPPGYHFDISEVLDVDSRGAPLCLRRSGVIASTYSGELKRVPKSGPTQVAELINQLRAGSDVPPVLRRIGACLP